MFQLLDAIYDKLERKKEKGGMLKKEKGGMPKVYCDERSKP